MSAPTDKSRQPKGIPVGGQFAASARTEPDVSLDEPTSDDLDETRREFSDTVRASFKAARDRVAQRRADENATFFPPAPLTPHDVEHLVQNKGRFEDGYDESDINSVLGGFEGARLVCVWGLYDDYGYGGDSEFAGIAKQDIGTTAFGDRAYTDAGSWRNVHPQVWEYLSDPESDLDPESIPSLLADEVFTGEAIDDMGTDGFSNVAPSNESCADEACDDDLSDGEGYDGYCGTHADKVAAHDDGEHENEADDECPGC